MRVLTLYAVDTEFAPWRKLRDLREVRIGEVCVQQAQVGRALVDFVVTGMGAENARRAAESVMQEPYQFCVAAGFAGSLRKTHSAGNVLVAEAVQQLSQSKTLLCSRNLVSAAQGDGAKRAKMFLTTDHIIGTAEEKARLAPFADAVDMESFAVLSAADAHKCSAVAIRVISDSFDEDVPANLDTTVDERGKVTIGGVFRYVAYHPLQLPALIRLGRKSRSAAEALAHFLEAYIKKISFSVHGWPPPELQEVAAR